MADIQFQLLTLICLGNQHKIIKKEQEFKFPSEHYGLALLYWFLLMTGLDQILLMTDVLDRLIRLGVIVIRF